MALVVHAAAPGHRAQVVQRVGGVVLVVHRARFGQRFGQAGGGLFVGIGAPVGHAQLHQRVARAGAVAGGARGVDHHAQIGHRALGLPGLRARRAAQGVHAQALRRVEGLRVRRAQRGRTVEPVQRIAQRKQRLRTLARAHQVVQRLGPDLGALEMLGELGLAFVLMLEAGPRNRPSPRRSSASATRWCSSRRRAPPRSR